MSSGNGKDSAVKIDATRPIRRKRTTTATSRIDSAVHLESDARFCQPERVAEAEIVPLIGIVRPASIG